MVLNFSGQDATILVLADSIYASQSAGAGYCNNVFDREVAFVMPANVPVHMNQPEYLVHFLWSDKGTLFEIL
jgi:hypothetical protein